MSRATKRLKTENSKAQELKAPHEMVLSSSDVSLERNDRSLTLDPCEILEPNWMCLEQFFQSQKSEPPWFSVETNSPPSIISKVHIGESLEQSPASFDLKNKLLGPGGSHLMHIQAKTGAGVSLRGRGADDCEMEGMDSVEPMHVYLEHYSYDRLEEARELAKQLILTMKLGSSVF
ncbi:KH homology domain-containing protein 4-like isoform X2 [Physella acuta]|uniref:KH homology domain-containing protein 4-like isoform X2 n=1 Tax=Physella acuta TaxID=109671 RepID=UPI0027DB81DB|nr:KH homology domain-containing protein 4-like isoform X2 [Physella acuta]